MVVVVVEGDDVEVACVGVAAVDVVGVGLFVCVPLFVCVFV